MSGKSKIEWTESTWNPVTGCTKASEGCRNCYAERMFKRLAGNPKTLYYGRKFNDVQCHYEALQIPLHWKKPRMIFVCSMADLFHPDVPFEFIDKVFAVMALCPQHKFQILTKRSDRMEEYLNAVNRSGGRGTIEKISEALCDHFHLDYDADDPTDYWPLPNVWIGVSVENDNHKDRIGHLIQCPAAVRFVSYEPALGPVDFDFDDQPYVCPDCNAYDSACIVDNHDDLSSMQCSKCRYTTDIGEDFPVRSGIDCVICGGESGHGARPMHPDIPRSARDQALAAGVAFFFKQWGEWIYGDQICADGKHPAGYLDGPGPFRVGKKRAGRLLDGREWNEMPKGVVR